MAPVSTLSVFGLRNYYILDEVVYHEFVLKFGGMTLFLILVLTVSL
jgi:hypothetical protein